MEMATSSAAVVRDFQPVEEVEVVEHVAPIPEPIAVEEAVTIKEVHLCTRRVSYVL